MTAVSGTVTEGSKEFSYKETSSGTHRGIQITEEGTKQRDAMHSYYLYAVGTKDKKDKLINLHEMADYNKEQAKVYKKLAEALAKKWVTQSKWPSDGWEFTYNGHQIRLHTNAK